MRVKALLLAAGLGTRLHPLTNEWPKCLMPIGGRPLLEYWLQTLRSVGIQKVLINTHFHADKVNEFLARDRFTGWVFSVYEAELLGTAGTLRETADFFQEQTALFIHADNWCQCDFSAFINYHLYQRPAHCAMTMMTFDADIPESCGIVELNEQDVVIGFHEKVGNPPGRRANAAVYMLEPEVLEWLQRHPGISDFSTEVLPRYIGRIATWHNAGVHRDIGTLPALRAAQLDPMPDRYWCDYDKWQARFESSPVFHTVNEQLFSGAFR
jgi:mannose-1-phosphate guanylyltransferase